MKKLSFFIGFLLISASSMAQMYLWQGGHYISANLDSITFSAEPVQDIIPEVAPTAGKYTIVWNAVDYSECNDLVFAGNYNDYSIKVSELAKFEKIEGYTNWYKAVVTPTVSIDLLAGKPCALAADGTFPTSWEHQWYGTNEHPCEIVKGNAEFLTEFGTETKLLVNQIGSVVYVRSYQFKYDPCKPDSVFDITFNLTTAQAMSTADKVYIAGNFVENSWIADAYEMIRIDNTHFTTTIKARKGQPYCYLANGSWEYVMLDFPIEDATCSNASSYITIDNETMTDYVYGFNNINAVYCSDDEDTELKVTVTPATLSLTPGAESEKLTVKITPAGNNYTVVWSSSNEAVATVKGGYVTGVAEGKATITATVGTAKGTCEVTVANDAALDNYAIGGWGLFGNPTYIEGTEREIELSNGSTVKCQLGLNYLYVWDNNLVYASGFSGTGYIAFAQVPIYWIIEGQYAGYFVGNHNGFYIDTIASGYTYEPYVAEAGQVADLNKYGTFFQQYAAYQKDTTNKLDNGLYSEALTGTQLCILYADDDFAQSWYVGNVKYAHLNDSTDATTKEEYYLYDATIEWFDFYSSDRWFGLKASFTEDGNLDKIIEPFDMRTVERHYTNISTTEVSAKPALNTNAAKSDHRTEATKQAPSNWVLGDMNRVHPATPIIENALRNTKM